MVHSVHVDSAVSQLASGRGRDSPSSPARSIGTEEAAMRSAARCQATSAGSIAVTPVTDSG